MEGFAGEKIALPDQDEDSEEKGIMSESVKNEYAEIMAAAYKRLIEISYDYSDSQEDEAQTSQEEADENEKSST